MEERLLNIIQEILEVSRDDLLKVLDVKEEWSSLQRVEVLFAVEDEYGITFSEEELADIDTPQRLINITKQKVG